MRTATSQNGSSLAWFGFLVLVLCLYFTWHEFAAPIRHSVASHGADAVDPSPTVGRQARVVGVADGDSLVVLLNESDVPKEVRVRLEGIDSPEYGQPYFQRAKQYMSNLCLGKQVALEATERDRYGRLVARVLVGEQDLRLEMLRAGLAWHFVRYNDQADLAAAEAWARSQRKGLWHDDAPVAPWVWRAQHSN